MIMRAILCGVVALAAASTYSATAAADPPTARPSPDAKSGYIVVLKDGVATPAQIAARHGKAFGFAPEFVYSHALKGYAANLSPTSVSAVARDPSVAFVADDGEVTASSTCSPTDTQCLPLGLDRIDVEQSSAFRPGPGLNGTVNVAVLDTGIDLTHPDLNVAGGIDCVNRRGNGQDENGHGTHVAGTIGALDNFIGVIGALPGARLWAVRILDRKGFGKFSEIICGIDFVTATRSDADPNNDIAVANMSLSGSGSDDGNCGETNRDAVHVAICASTTAGVAYVVAAGNSGQDLQNVVPASYNEVIAVTAMTDFDGMPGGLGGETCLPGFDFQDDTIAFFSNFATLPSDQTHTLAASGVCILSTFLGGGYELISGTSQSAPAVAGTVALCVASRSCAGLTPAQIIQKTVSDAAGYNNSHKGAGYGFVGDPIRPLPGKYFGYLVRAGLY